MPLVSVKTQIITEVITMFTRTSDVKNNRILDMITLGDM